MIFRTGLGESVLAYGVDTFAGDGSSAPIEFPLLGCASSSWGRGDVDATKENNSTEKSNNQQRTVNALAKFSPPRAALEVAFKEIAARQREGSANLSTSLAECSVCLDGIADGSL